jgi:hypothetical protein
VEGPHDPGLRRKPVLEAPSSYGDVSKGLLARIGVEPSRLADAYDEGFYRRHGLAASIYFDRTSYGTDRLVPSPIVDPSDRLPRLDPRASIEGPAIATSRCSTSARSSRSTTSPATTLSTPAAATACSSASGVRSECSGPVPGDARVRRTPDRRASGPSAWRRDPPSRREC